ncbi:hypothetical protein MMC28_009314 [Mycoblastus sanguinarius]|nr:hypothetical protein [Mycoblastus sanguinarius]
MEKVNPQAPPKPCNFFDMIGGTSTGGLITLMLGRLKMSVDEYIAAYGEMSEEVFVKQGYRINLKGDVQGRCDTAVLEKAVRECIKDAKDNIRCIVSIGIGEPTLSGFGKKFWEIAKTLKEIATETERTADAFQNRHFGLVQANRYYRFNVKHGLDNVGLEEWAQRDKIVAVKRHYLRTGVKRGSHNLRDVNIESTPTAPETPQLQNPLMAAQRSPSESPARSAFSVLDASSRYINRSNDSNLRRLTEAALAVYDTVYENSKDENGTVSRKTPSLLQKIKLY